jgi:hypothetical protein
MLAEVMQGCDFRNRVKSSVAFIYVSSLSFANSFSSPLYLRSALIEPSRRTDLGVRSAAPDPGRDSRRTKLLVWVKGRRYYRAGRLVKPAPCSIKTRIVGRYEGYMTINPRAAARSRERACRLYHFNEHFPVPSFHPNYTS